MTDATMEVDDRLGPLNPRVARSRSAILEAASALIVERGFRECTIDAIVERTGIARTTLYRHWPSRAALMEQAIDHISRSRPLPDTGSLRGDLLELFVTRGPLKPITHPGSPSGSMPTPIDNRHGDPGLTSLNAKIMGRIDQVFRALIERARARGEVRPDLSVDAMVNILFSTVIADSRRPQGLQAPIADVVDMIDILTRGARP